MRKQKSSQRFIAVFFLIIFFPTLVPYNLYASNNNPMSPEASGFEPVDAKDMVNLVTGQYSYVLPLLNVPSPGGGYPLSLAYHGGIALDQEASWAGLGWSINPGSIARNVNGYPDDYNSIDYPGQKESFNEHFYDSGGSDVAYSVGLGYSNGAVSVGVGFNWGSNQAFGGSVSLGTGIDVGKAKLGVGVSAGTNGGSVNAGLKTPSGLSVGVSADTNENLGFQVGYSNTNGEGVGIGYNTNGTFSKSAQFGVGNDNLLSLGSSISSSGQSFNVGVINKTKNQIDGGVGAGISLSHGSSINNHYNILTSGWVLPIIVPTKIGVFSLSFGKQKIKYAANTSTSTSVIGPIHFSSLKFRVRAFDPAYNRTSDYYLGTFDEAVVFSQEQQILHPQIIYTVFNDAVRNDSAGKHRGGLRVGHDVNEFPIDVEDLKDSNIDIEKNNAVFPNYDNYYVQSQGLSGVMSPKVFENGALVGVPDLESKKGFSVTSSFYFNQYDQVFFDQKPFFYFENEVSTYFDVCESNYNLNNNNDYIYDFLNTTNFDSNPKVRRKLSNFIEYYTNGQIKRAYDFVNEQGYLKPSANGFNRDSMPDDGIGAYKITTPDGMTYHYSLPVYNHDIVTRTFGIVKQRRLESQSYLEKKQTVAYATHWLLTSVTGPDFVDNGDGKAGEGDLGYWVDFEYGKYTDSFIWKAPFKKDYFIDEKDPDIKTWIRGRKQLYYLDRVKTRTHTALFVKSQRNDSKSDAWNYSSSNQHLGPDGDIFNNPVLPRFTVPSQNQLKLDKIILVKNSDDTLDKNFGPDSVQQINVKYQPSYPDNFVNLNLMDNVIDISDNWGQLIEKSIKVINLDYDYSLVSGDNRLTLKKVFFNGKNNSSVLPPYQFEYHNGNVFNIDDKDPWGYCSTKTFEWSLKKIVTPQGANIEIEYERGKFKCVTPIVFKFSNKNSQNFTATSPVINENVITGQSTFASDVILNYGKGLNVPLYINQEVSVKYRKVVNIGNVCRITTYNHLGHISETFQTAGIGKCKVAFDGNPVVTTSNTNIPTEDELTIEIKMDSNAIYTMGPPRVKRIYVKDANQDFVSEYLYGGVNDGYGFVTYLPLSVNLDNDIPYSSELPAPRIMYDLVTMKSFGNQSIYQGKTEYKFNIIKQKDFNNIKFEDFYAINKTENSFVNSGKSNYRNTNDPNIQQDFNVNVSKYQIKNNLAAVGQLLSVSSYNSQNQLLGKTKYEYYNFENIPNNIGITKENYQMYKIINYQNNSQDLDKWNVNSTSRVNYPSILKSITTFNGSYNYKTEFNDFDLISGVSKEVLKTTSDGKMFKIKTVPAYSKYPQMGSKVDNINNRNMLSQTAAEYSYIMDGGVWKETGVGITTWNNEWIYVDTEGNLYSPTADKEKIWRKHKSYTWNGAKDANGIFLNYNSSNDDSFDWSGIGVQPSQWKKISEVTLYDRYSMTLEAKDINGNKASTKMGDNDTKIMATGNAGYNEMYYTGGEYLKNGYWLDPEVRLVSGSLENNKFHSGKSSVATNSGSQLGVFMRAGQHKAGKYKLTVWVHKDNAGKARLRVWDNTNLLSFSASEEITAGNWVLKTAYLDVPSGDYYPFLNSVDGSTVFFDDLMIRPVSSSVKGFVYDDFDQLTYIVNDNGLATRFVYDAGGRLIETYVEVFDDPSNGLVGGFKLKTKHKINFKNL